MKYLIGNIIGLAIGIMLVLLYPANTCEGAELNAVLDGWSEHYNSDYPYNEHHEARGLEYITDERTVYTGVILRDSYGNPSWYIGVGQYWPLFDYNQFRVSWGGIIAAAKHTTLNDGEPGLVLLPFVELKYGVVGLTFTGMPNIESDGTSVVAAMIKMEVPF